MRVNIRGNLTPTLVDRKYNSGAGVKFKTATDFNLYLLSTKVFIIIPVIKHWRMYLLMS